MFETLVELVVFVRQHKRFRDEVKVGLWVFDLHLLDINGEPIFPCNFEAEWKVVDLLGWSEPFIEIIFSLRVGPQHVPVVPICADKAIKL